MLAIETRDLTVVYRKGLFSPPREALSALELSVEEGEVFGFIGANGAGKTTTIKALLGLVRPSRGEAFLLGRSFRERASRREVGFLPEAPYFYDYLTGREALCFYGGLSGLAGKDASSRAGELLERVGLASAADRAIGTYSRGMRQRLGLAQAIIHRPRLVILDEPMSGLDPLGRRDVRLLMLELAREGVTVFFSTHILSDVEALCARVGVLVAGRLVASGPVGELAAPRVKCVEIACSHVRPELVAGLASPPGAVRSDGETVTFEVPDEEAAQRAARLVLESGGRLRSLVPIKESLEEVFTRLQGGSAGGPAV